MVVDLTDPMLEASEANAVFAVRSQIVLGIALARLLGC